ncbi:hypothetical protein CPB85DRAFT_1442173 [Mucidula mucida]|nr:hypothetical protein CPB85DRAFT_1442173 [Mucidula mucida]
MTSLTQFPLTTNFLTLAASLAKQHHIAVSWQREAVYLGVSNRRLLQASRRSPPRYRYAFGMYLKFPSVPTLVTEPDENLPGGYACQWTLPVLLDGLNEVGCGFGGETDWIARVIPRSTPFA